MNILYVIEKNKNNNKTLYASYNKEDTLEMFKYLKKQEYDVILKKFKEVNLK